MNGLPITPEQADKGVWIVENGTDEEFNEYVESLVAKTGESMERIVSLIALRQMVNKAFD